METFHDLFDPHLEAPRRIAPDSRTSVSIRRIAATKHAAIDCVGLADSARLEFLDRLTGPERLLEAIHRALVREYRNILSIAIAQTHTEQASSPSMTASRSSEPAETAQSAIRRRMPAQGRLRHVGRIHKRYPLNASVPNPPGAIDCRFHSARQARRKRQRKSLVVSHGGPVRSRGLHPLPTCQNEGYLRGLTPLTKR